MVRFYKHFILRWVIILWITKASSFYILSLLLILNVIWITKSYFQSVRFLQILLYLEFLVIIILWKIIIYWNFESVNLVLILIFLSLVVRGARIGLGLLIKFTRLKSKTFLISTQI